MKKKEPTGCNSLVRSSQGKKSHETSQDEEMDHRDYIATAAICDLRNERTIEREKLRIMHKRGKRDRNKILHKPINLTACVAREMWSLTQNLKQRCFHISISDNVLLCA
jgi:hypothetical protein